jgi:hypothetical protein
MTLIEILLAIQNTPLSVDLTAQLELLSRTENEINVFSMGWPVLPPRLITGCS